MSDIDTSREAVERLAKTAGNIAYLNDPHHTFGRPIAATLRALLAERDAAVRDLATAREALRLVLPLAEAWADGKSRGHPDHECIDAARAALAAQPAAEGERG
jgi:hypothetical protein